MDLGAVDIDSYIVAGLNDHIVPWENAYRATQLLGGRSRFVLSTSGHIQAMVNPPAPDSRSSYRVAEQHPEDPNGFLETAAKVPGSWCPTTPSGWPRDRVSSSPRRSGSGGAATARTARRRAPTSSRADMSSFLPTRGVDSAVSATTARDLLWPPFAGPGDLARHRAGPARPSAGFRPAPTELVTRAAELWPDRTAASVLSDAERWQPPARGTFAELAADVHRAANVLARPRGRAQRRRRGRLGQLRRAGAAAAGGRGGRDLRPDQPGARGRARHRARPPRGRARHSRLRAGAGPGRLGACPRRRAGDGADALLALRPTAPEGAAPALAPLGSTQVAYLAERIGRRRRHGASGPPPAPGDVASYLHTGGTTGTPKLAARTHANEVANAWMITSFGLLRPGSAVFAALPLFHTNALVVTVLGAAAQGPARGLGRTARLTRPCPVRELLEDRRALPDRGDVRSSHGLRRAHAGPGGRGHLEPRSRSSEPPRCRPQCATRSSSAPASRCARATA